MRIKNKEEFGDLGTVAIYKFHKYIPDVTAQERITEVRPAMESDSLSNYTAKKILYHGGTKRFDHISFAEYDFSYVLENQKFNNRDLISYLDQETRDNVGKNLGSLEKVNSALFPTISGSSQEIEYDYFGSLTLSSATVYLFNLDPECYKIEIYEDYIDSNNKVGGFIDAEYLKVVDPDKLTVEPVVTIYLGPEDKCANNPNFMYYEEDPWFNSYQRTESLGELSYSKLYDEIYAGKTVWLVLSPNNSLQHLNLSFAAWKNSDDANRYKHLHNLRNDDYYKTDKFDIVKRKPDTDIFTDVRNGKLLATQIQLSPQFPILNKKKQLLEEQGDNYDPAVEYNIGRKVTFNGKEFIAIKKNNRGRYPGFSSCWALNDKLTDYYTTRITILADPVEGGYSIPSRQITLNTYEDQQGTTSNPMSFKVISSPGYNNNKVQYENNGVVVPLILNTDYTSNDILSDTDYFEYKQITILSNGWRKILSSSSKERLIFSFDLATILTNISYNLTGINKPVVIEIDPLDPPTAPYIELVKLTIDGVDYTDAADISNILTSTDTAVGLTKDNIISMRFNIVSNNNLYKYSSSVISKNISGELVEFSPEIETGRTDGVYWIELKDMSLDDCAALNIELYGTNKRKVTFDFFDEFEVEHINTEVLINTSFSSRFYGTYNRDSLTYVKIGNIILTKTNPDQGDYHLIKNEGDTFYTLTIDHVTEDLKIELYNNNTQPLGEV